MMIKDVETTDVVYNWQSTVQMQALNITEHTGLNLTAGADT